MTNDSYHSMAGDTTCNNCFEKATVECRDSDEYVSVLGSVHAKAIHRKRAVGSTTAATWLKYLSSAACPPLGSPLVFPTIYQTDAAVAAPLQPLFLLAILIFVLVGLYRIFILFRKRSKSCHPCETFIPVIPSPPHWLYGHLEIIFNPDFREGQRAAYVDHADSLGRTAMWFLSKPAVSVVKGCDVQKVLQASAHRGPSLLILRHQRRLFGN